MPLWKIHHPVGAFSAADKQEIARRITGIYRMLPSFYVSVIFQEVAADMFFMGGEPTDGFVRIFVDHIARNFDDEDLKARFLGATAKQLAPFIADRGLRWEMHVDETPFSLWLIDGLRPPAPNSPAERRWKADNRPSAYEEQAARPA